MMLEEFAIQCSDSEKGNNKKNFFQYFFDNKIRFNPIGFCAVTIFSEKDKFDDIKKGLQDKGLEVKEITITPLGNLPEEKAREIRQKRFLKSIPL